MKIPPEMMEWVNSEMEKSSSSKKVEKLEAVQS
jgi:hypothetical protein